MYNIFASKNFYQLKLFIRRAASKVFNYATSQNWINFVLLVLLINIIHPPLCTALKAIIRHLVHLQKIIIRHRLSYCLYNRTTYIYLTNFFNYVQNLTSLYIGFVCKILLVLVLLYFHNLLLHVIYPLFT